MEIPYRIETTKGTTCDYLESIGFVLSNIDKCIFYRDDIIFTVYVDDVIFLGQSDDQLTGIIKELMGIDLKVEEPRAPSRLCGCKYQAPTCSC
ncbi:hypothetical protein ACHAW6_005596 [Cyclotella cf. meneghiniana]